MSEVSFYHLTSQPIEVALPKLLERALEAGLRVVIRTPDRGVTQSLDQVLWTYDPASFLAHGTDRSGPGEHQPVYLTSGNEVPNGAEALIVINDAELGEVEAFARYMLMFDGRLEEVRDLTRTRWRELSAKGHQITYWKQSEKGRWESGAEA